MSTELIVPEELQNDVVAPVLMHAQDIAVSDQPTRDAAMEFLKAIKGAQKKAQEYWAPLKTKAHAAWKQIVAAESEMLDPLTGAEATVKQKVVAFDQEQERIRIAEQRRLQAEADAKAEAERQRLLKEAAKLKTPELKEERLAAAEAVIAPTVVVAPSVAKGPGEATVKRWSARLTSMQELVASAAAGNGLALALLQFNQVAANKQATATKNNISVPGVEWVCDETLAVRAGK